MKNKQDYKPEICECCGQEKTYLIKIDRGTARIVAQIARFIGKKGINAVHPRKEMEGTYLSSNEVGNLTRPRIHGLIAKIKGNPGNYCLTRKGSQFLHGRQVPSLAIVAKSGVSDKNHNIGYYEPEKFSTNIQGALGAKELWEGIGYTIEEGDVIQKEPKEEMTSLF